MSKASVWRLPLAKGQNVYLQKLGVYGTIDEVWPVEGGSEARIRLQEVANNNTGDKYIIYRFEGDEAVKTEI